MTTGAACLLIVTVSLLMPGRDKIAVWMRLVALCTSKHAVGGVQGLLLLELVVYILTIMAECVVWPMVLVVRGRDTQQQRCVVVQGNVWRHPPLGDVVCTVWHEEVRAHTCRDQRTWQSTLSRGPPCLVHCCWPSSAQSFLVPSATRLRTSSYV